MSQRDCIYNKTSHLQTVYNHHAAHETSVNEKLILKLDVQKKLFSGSGFNTTEVKQPIQKGRLERITNGETTEAGHTSYERHFIVV